MGSMGDSMTIDRVLAMPANIQEPFLSTIDQGWVECQVASHELMKGLEEGKWTLEDIRAAIKSK
jgi:hypothetical protein